MFGISYRTWHYAVYFMDKCSIMAVAYLTIRELCRYMEVRFIVAIEVTEIAKVAKRKEAVIVKGLAKSRSKTAIIAR